MERILIAIVVMIVSWSHYSTGSRIDVLEDHIFMQQDNMKGIFRTKVTVTMYHPVPGQTDDTPNQTADGTIIDIEKASKYRYVAVSRDLLNRWGGPLDYGDYIVIEGAGEHSGIYQIRDTMNPKWTRRVDILRSPGSRQFKYSNITLVKYNENLTEVLAWEN